MKHTFANCPEWSPRLLGVCEPHPGRVKATVAVELTGAAVALLAAWGQMGPLVEDLVDLDQAPPWWLLAAFPAAGLVAALLRAARPDEVVRRWHGVVLRRVDERLG